MYFESCIDLCEYLVDRSYIYNLDSINDGWEMIDAEWFWEHEKNWNMLLNNTKFENLVSANIGSRPHSMTNVPPLFSTDSPHNNKRVLSSNTTFLVQENACLSVKAASAPRPMAPTAVPMVRACCHTDSAGSCPLLYLSLRFLRASANSIKPSCVWVDGQVCAHVCVCVEGGGGGGRLG